MIHGLEAFVRGMYVYYLCPAQLKLLSIPSILFSFSSVQINQFTHISLYIFGPIVGMGLDCIIGLERVKFTSRPCNVLFKYPLFLCCNYNLIQWYLVCYLNNNEGPQFKGKA